MRKQKKETLPEFIAKRQTKLVQDKQILEAIRQQQLDLIKHKFLSLLTVIYAAPIEYFKEYVKPKANPDYRRFVEELVTAYEMLDAEEPIISNKIEQIEQTSEQRQAIVNLFMDVVGHLYQVDYQPPSDPWEIAIHLHTMRRLFTSTKPDISITEAILSMNFAKLLAAASAMKSHQITKDSRELPRIKSIADAKSKRKDEGKTPVYEAFYKLTIKRGSKLNRVVTNIHEILKVKLQHPPSISTIRRYLEDDPKIMAHFNNEGNFWIYQT